MTPSNYLCIFIEDSFNKPQGYQMHGGNLHRNVAGALYQRTSHNGSLHVAGFGRYYLEEKEPDWTFKSLGDPKSSIARFLPNIANQLGVSIVLAPSPVAFNGKIINAEDLTTCYPISNDVTVYRNAEKPADGILLKRGQLYAISAAGCAIFRGCRIDRDTNEIVCVGAAHMGLESLINNVGGNLLMALGNAPEDTYFSIEFPIDAAVFIHEWDRPHDGEKNRLLCEEVVDLFGPSAVVGWSTEEKRLGQINLVTIARTQLGRLGVPQNHIESGLRIGKDSVFYTTRDGSNKRNLILVSYH